MINKTKQQTNKYKKQTNNTKNNNKTKHKKAQSKMKIMYEYIEGTYGLWLVDIPQTTQTFSY